VQELNYQGVGVWGGVPQCRDGHGQVCMHAEWIQTWVLEGDGEDGIAVVVIKD